MKTTWLAIGATLLVHLSMTLGANSWSYDADVREPEQSQAQFAEVSLSEDSPALNADDPWSEGGQNDVNQKVANLKANDAARMSSEKQSSGSERQVTQGTDRTSHEKETRQDQMSPLVGPCAGTLMKVAASGGQRQLDLRYPKRLTNQVADAVFDLQIPADA